MRSMLSNGAPSFANEPAKTYAVTTRIRRLESDSESLVKRRRAAEILSQKSRLNLLEEGA